MGFDSDSTAYGKLMSWRSGFERAACSRAATTFKQLRHRWQAVLLQTSNAESFSASCSALQ